ncbi:hypothetical protein An02g04470 [Aspergillus niger]|uniref:Uncharacterized protein n=2 Tax=Aspergillus niger TaxID=5061 RepID=A2QCR4_ASPNC|nr:hypothetical protein An02g04470 [Aspergillus niger]CAK37586.1 hypothetical protein An02g04470 [Aspergillus niger]
MNDDYSRQVKNPEGLASPPSRGHLMPCEEVGPITGQAMMGGDTYTQWEDVVVRVNISPSSSHCRAWQHLLLLLPTGSGMIV